MIPKVTTTPDGKALNSHFVFGYGIGFYWGYYPDEIESAFSHLEELVGPREPATEDFYLGAIAGFDDGISQVSEDYQEDLEDFLDSDQDEIEIVEQQTAT